MRPFSWSLALEAKLMKCMDAELPKELDGLSFLAFMQDPTCNPKKTLRFISRYSSFIVLRCGVRGYLYNRPLLSNIYILVYIHSSSVFSFVLSVLNLMPEIDDFTD